LGKDLPFHKKSYIYIKEENDMSADNQNNLLKCEICGRLFKSITNSHLRDKHNMTTTEYKTKFPDAKMIRDDHFEILAKWIYSEENSEHWRNQALIQKDSQSRKNAVIHAVKSDEYRKSHSKLMKKLVRENPDKYKTMWDSITGENHQHYGKSNWARWFEKFGKDGADLRLIDWKNKNKIPGGSRNTKIELMVKKVLEDNNINYIHQYEGIYGIYVDFYLPKYNLVIEVDGDYWHANPNKYLPEQIINYPGNRKIKAKDVWEKDKQRDSLIKESGYFVKRIFGSDVTEKNVLSLINNID
jgi:very-short-patch-repair endonuclease